MKHTSNASPRWNPLPSIRHLLCLLLALALFQPGMARAASLPSGFIETDILGYWPEVAGSTFDSTGVMYVWERSGKVWIVENDVKRSTPLIDISEEVGAYDDYGLLGFALDPNFRQNGYFYMLYVVDHHHLTKFGTANYSATVNEYNRATIGRLTRYTARSSDSFRSVDPASRTILVGESITNGFPMLFITHGVGGLVFGTDGTLLVSCGDGASLSDTGSEPASYYSQGLSEGIIRTAENVGAFRSQLLNCLNGKLLRLDPATGNGLPSNPFYDAANPRSPKSRVWALGLRNPFRISLVPGTGSHFPADGNPGTIYVGDVGYDTWEEIDVVTGPGMNFGWPVFEGLSTGYDADALNLDAPNPLFGVSGCTKQYFSFKDLIKEASLSAPSWPNPCNSAQQIPATVPRWVHARPAMDWHHAGAGTGPTRTGIFSNGVAAVVNIGTAGSPIAGPQFSGNCVIGGAWYNGTNFPAQYQGAYFFADVDAQWIKTITTDSSAYPLAVANFATSAAAVVSVAVHPITGTMYYVLFYDGVRKITYVGGGNQPPTARASANVGYGPGPLAVQFTGNTSTDPEGLALSYSWNFGDGSAPGTAANPSHTFTASPGVPTKYTVTLTVTDSASQTSTTNLTISVNNTPPVVNLLSPAAGTLYPMAGDTTYNLLANVTDTEHSDAQLQYQWQTVLHHNSHLHPDPIDTNHVTTTVITPVGCDGNTYFYRISLIVSDPAGLSTSAYVDLYPDCTTNTPPTITDIASQTVNQNTSTGPLPFVVGDAETTVTSLTLSTASSNPTLVPAGNIVLAGTGATRSVTVTPAANQSGTATITVTVSDGSLTASDSFLLTVNAPGNTAPTISDIANVAVNEDTPTPALAFTVSDAETAAGSLIVTASSDNLTLIPNANLVLGGSGASRTLTVTPAANLSGTATITVNVNDGSLTASDTFVVTVNAVNDLPTISNIADLTIAQDTSSGALAFTVGDIETAAASLVVTGTSSNPALVPNANIIFGGSGASRTVTVTPATGQSGTTTVTVTVNDGTATAVDTFILTVTPSSAPTYLLTESFEGTGYENTGWTETGTPNEDYTAIPLHGAQALNCIGNQHLTRTHRYTNSFNLYFRVRWNAWSDYNNIIYWDNSSYGTAAILYAGDNRMELDHGSASAIGTTVLTTNVTYHVWVEWTKGTGANGTMKLYLATTGTKPASPEASITTGTGTATERMYLGPTGAGPNVIFDRLLVDDVPIGNVLDGNQAPTISDIANQSIAQNTATAALPFTIGDAETAATGLTVTAASANTTLVPNANLVLGGTGANRTLTVTPAAGQVGTSTITVTVSDGSLTASDTFVLTVNAVNNPPTISDIANQTINEDGTTGALAFTIGDTETAAASLTVAASSSNTGLIPNANLVLGGSGANRSLTITPAANQSGTATITVTVSDGTNNAIDTLLLTVNAVNDAPTISGVANQTTNEDTATAALAFTIGDIETAAASLVVTASSSDTILVPNANLVLGGSGASRTVTVTPAANQSGVTTITLSVNDGGTSTTTAFTVTVNPVNDTPTITAIPDQSITQNTSTAPLPFTIGDVETAAASLVVTASSSNTALVPNASIVLGGSGANRTVTVTPAAGQTGTAIITVTVSDGTASASDTFVLAVNTSNTAPTISDIVNQTINEDGTTGALAFTVNDAETAAASLIVSTASSNTGLVPNSNLVLAGSGANRTLTITPAANQSGTATITVTVSDGSLTASDTLLVTVNAVNDAPVISDIVNQTINEDGTTGTLAFTVGDIETAAASLVVTASSDNLALIPDANLVLGGSGANRTLTVTPAANQSGTATITVTVSDGSAIATDTFVVTVNAVNDVPTISDVANQSILQDTATAALPFTIGDVETAAASLLVTASSANTTLVPNANLVLGGSGANRTITVTPAAGQSGTAVITLTVSDGSAIATDTFTLTVTSSSTPTYLLSEGFEGTGYENTGWTETGTPNENYTTTVLHGSQSLNCSGNQNVRRTFQNSTSFNLYFRVRWNTWRDYANVIYWDNVNYGTSTILYADDNRLQIVHGSASANGTTAITANVTYHVWMEWTKGTGANGTMKLYMSTTGIKPANPEASITTGTGTATERMYVGPTANGPNVIFDRLLIDDAPIGSNP